MPYVSRAQRAYMHIHHPEVAKEFDEKTPKGKKLPYHVKKRKRRKLSRAASYYLSLAGAGRTLSRRQRYALSLSGVAMGAMNTIAHPVEAYKRQAGNRFRQDEDLPPISENSMISVKDIINHHKTHEQVHRSGYEKFKKSDFPGTKAIAIKHKRLWHHHAGIRTRYEAIDRAGKTHVSERQYRRDSEGRFASFALALNDEVVWGVKKRIVPRDYEMFLPALIPAGMAVLKFIGSTAAWTVASELVARGIQAVAKGGHVVVKGSKQAIAHAKNLAAKKGGKTVHERPAAPIHANPHDGYVHSGPDPNARSRAERAVKRGDFKEAEAKRRAALPTEGYVPSGPDPNRMGRAERRVRGGNARDARKIANAKIQHEPLPVGVPLQRPMHPEAIKHHDLGNKSQAKAEHLRAIGNHKLAAVHEARAAKYHEIARGWDESKHPRNHGKFV